MSDKNLQININATAAGLEKSVARAETSLNRLRKSHSDAWSAINETEKWLQNESDEILKQVEAREERRQEIWQNTGAVIAGASAAIGVGLGLAARAAMQWESDWAGVAKVLDGTPEQMEAVEDQVRDLAQVLPATSTEIAGVAAAAAQLGVAREDLAGFTATAVRLGTATVLSSEDAAMGLARLSTVMGVSHSEINNMGSSLVELGNNFAAMEDDILAMSLRLSGTGNQIGLTSGQVMGLATAFSAVGIEAELGGGAFSRVLGRMQAAVLEGGDKLEGFAAVAGVSADEFADAFQDRPNEAIVRFLQGLDQVNESGGSVYTTLRELGLGGTEIADVAGRASAAWETVAEAMNVGNTAFADGNALLEEAAARYETTEAQVQLARNSINDLGITIGEAFLPVIGDAAESTSALVQYFQELPEPVQQATGAVGAVGAAVGVAASAFLLGVPKVAEFRDAMGTMGPRTQAVGRGLGSVVGILGGPWGIALAGAVTVGALFVGQQAEATARVNDLTQALLMSNGAIDENVRMTAVKTLADDGVLEKAREAGISLELVTDAYLGQAGAMEQLDAEVMAAIESGTTWNDTLLGGEPVYSDAAVSASELAVKMQLLDGDVDEATQGAIDQQNAMGADAEAMGGAAAASDLLMGAQGGLTGSYREATSAADEYRRAVEELTGSALSAIDAEIAWQEAIDNASEALTTNGVTLDLNTEAGRSNQRALNDLIRDGGDHIAMLIETEGVTEDTRAEQERMRKKIYDVALAFGASEEEADEYADMLNEIPEEASTSIDVDAEGRWWVLNSGGTSPMSGRGIGGPNFADGGAVVGPGGPTDDVIPAMLSNGEHVIPADEVAMAGGQDGVYRLRSAIRSGYVHLASGGAPEDSEPRRFARGGAVSGAAKIINDHDEETRVNIQRLYEAVLDGFAKDVGKQLKEYANSAGGVVAAWQSQLGVPYSWGGGGPGGPSRGFGRGAGTVGFDCSSLMQYGWAQAGVTLPRVTYDQIHTGTKVPVGQQRPGDLVFPHLGHVAGVVSPNKLIHAPYTGATVSYRSMYASPLAIRRPHKVMDTGGIWGTGETAVNLSGANERVLNPRQTIAFERLVDGVLAVGGDGGGTPIVVNVNHVPGYSTPQDIQRAGQHLERMARAGRPR